MTSASRQRTKPPGLPARIQSKTGRSSSYTPNLGVGTGPRPRRHGYLVAASRLARVRLSPAGRPSGWTRLGSRRVRMRRVCALPSKPPMSAATSSRAVSPLWPKGGCPRSCARQATSTTSARHPSAPPNSRPIWATSRLCVSRLRTKSSLPGPRTWVFADRRRSAAEWMRRPRSRAKSSRSARLCTGSSETQRSRSLRLLTTVSLCARGAQPPSATDCSAAATWARWASSRSCEASQFSGSATTREDPARPR